MRDEARLTARSESRREKKEAQRRARESKVSLPWTDLRYLRRIGQARVGYVGNATRLTTERRELNAREEEEEEVVVGGKRR